MVVTTECRASTLQRNRRNFAKCHDAHQIDRMLEFSETAVKIMALRLMRKKLKSPNHALRLMRR